MLRGQIWRTEQINCVVMRRGAGRDGAGKENEG